MSNGLRRVALALASWLAISPAEAAGNGSMKDYAMRSWLACLRHAAASLDDGSTDALTVSLAIQPLCDQQMKNVESAFLPTFMTLAAHKAATARFEAYGVQVGTTIVLQGRRK